MKSLPRFLCALLLPALVLLVVACSPKNTETTLPADETSPFVGNAACEPCHAAEFTSHQKTRHMATMQEATRAGLGALAPEPGQVPGGGMLSEQQGRFVVNDLPLQLVLGSGKTGMTFIALADDSCTEIQTSYFPHEKLWRTTPGQEKPKAVADQRGRIVIGQEAQRCLGCHAVTLPENSLRVERRFFGVGCESCHGPGREHVATMGKGEKPAKLAIESLKGAGGEQLNTLCGSCHRTQDDVGPLSKSTNRFQPYGLSLSRCFKESKDKLTCVTCHSPHEDAGTDPKPYEKACLSCHSAPKKACPVNPKEKCVGCHMPERPAFEVGDTPTKMADHFIKIYRANR
jgi:hypothetical protein